MLASRLSLVAVSLLFFREHLKKEMFFHGRFKAVIKHATFYEIIQHFDTFVVSCLIRGSQPHNIVMLPPPLVIHIIELLTNKPV